MNGYVSFREEGKSKEVDGVKDFLFVLDPKNFDKLEESLFLQGCEDERVRRRRVFLGADCRAEKSGQDGGAFIEILVMLRATERTVFNSSKWNLAKYLENEIKMKHAPFCGSYMPQIQRVDVREFCGDGVHVSNNAFL